MNLQEHVKMSACDEILLFILFLYFLFLVLFNLEQRAIPVKIYVGDHSSKCNFKVMFSKWQRDCFPSFLQKCLARKIRIDFIQICAIMVNVPSSYAITSKIICVCICKGARTFRDKINNVQLNYQHTSGCRKKKSSIL